MATQESNAQVQSEHTSHSDGSTYGQILRSSAIFGSSTAVNILIGMLRTKLMAMLLGPSGVGLMGMYSSIADLASAVCGMGINSSGVRQIAAAVGTGDHERVALTAQVLRRTSLLLGIVGALILVALAGPISSFTFGTQEYVVPVTFLSLAVLLKSISDGQSALIQGMRQIGVLAKLSILGSVYGTVISIGMVYCLGKAGVAPALVGIAAMGTATAWWYSRKIVLTVPLLSAGALGEEAKSLLKLGLAFMSSGLMMMGAAYLVRLIVVREAGVESAGLYQAAWTLGGLYVGFILQAMGTDFYPRLTAVADDNEACNRVVNEQAHVSMLLAGPGVIATLVLAPWILQIFYTSEFHGALGVLRWICLGMALRIISWPMGFIILAKGAQLFFFWSELAWSVVYLSAAWFCTQRYGLEGAGLAFFISYMFHCVMNYGIASILSEFRWSAETLLVCLLFVSLLATVLAAIHLLPSNIGMPVQILAIMASLAFAVRTCVMAMPDHAVSKMLASSTAWFKCSI